MMLKLNYKNKFLNELLIFLLISWQIINVSLISSNCGVQFQNDKGNLQSIISSNDYSPEPVLIKKNSKELQVLIPLLEKQKYKIVSKYNIYYEKLLLLICSNEEEEIYFLDVNYKNLNPRSPPANLI